MSRLFTLALGIFLSLQAAQASAALVAATLPTSRSVEVGQTATAFATIINSGSELATNCRIEAAPGLDVSLSYQTTDPATNAVVGAVDTPEDISPGAAQSFVLSVIPNSAFSPQQLELRYLCDGGEAAETIEGLNTLLISGSTVPVPDVIAIAQTASLDGVLDVSADGTASAFAAASVNVGAAASITARARATFDFVGDIAICPTNSSSGECLVPPGESATVSMGNLQTDTYSVFVSTSEAISADFANNRILLEFLDENGVLRGATGIAVREGAPSVLSGVLGVISGGLGLLPGDSNGGQSGAPVEVLVDVGGSGFRALGIGDPASQVVLTGAGISAGAIDAFGSIITNGRRINTDSADFSIDGVAGSQDDLKVGQDVLVVLDDTPDTAVAVIYRSKVKGPVTEIAAVDPINGTAELVVLGQRIRVNGTTLFDDISLDTLAVGQLLEVSGVLDNSGVTQASFIELKTDLPLYKVVGAISGLSGNQFSIGELSIDFSNAVLDDFTSAGPVEGAIVEVKGSPQDFQSPSLLFASKVEPLPSLRLDSMAEVQLEGFIDSVASQADFTVQRQRVVTSGTTQIIDGTSESIALGVKVDVRGTIDANGVLTATSVRIKPTESVRAEGVLTGVNGATNQLSLLGVTFQAVSQTDFEDDSEFDDPDLTLAELQSGQFVEIRGYLDGDQLIAVEVERDDSDTRARLRGPVTSFDSGAAVVTLLGIPVTGQAGVTQYEDLSDQIVSQAEFFNLLQIGDFVKASWDNFTSTSEVADEISLED